METVRLQLDAEGESSSPRGRSRRRMPLFPRRFTKPGAAPGRFAGEAVPGSARVRVVRYDAGAFEEQDDIDPQQIPPAEEGKVLWVDVRGVRDHPVVEAVGKRFGLHPLTIADVVNVGQRPKAEDYQDLLFVVLRMAVRVEGGSIERDGEPMAGHTHRWRWEQFSLCLGKGFVLSFQEADGDCLEVVRARLRGRRRTLRDAGPDALAVSIVDAIVDGYFPLLEEMGDQLENLEDLIVDQPTQAVLTQVYHARRNLMGFRRAIWPLREVLGALIREDNMLLGDSVRPYLRDAADHAMQVIDVLESYRDLTASFIDVYLSSVSNRTNEVMRVLTIIATIFIPLTFLAGVYGMNFDVLPELHWRYGYAYFWGVSLTTAAGMLWGFWRLGWIGRGRRRN